MAYDFAEQGDVLLASEFLKRNGESFDYRQRALILAIAWEHYKPLQPPFEGVYTIKETGTYVSAPVCHLSKSYYERLMKMRQ